MNPNLTPEMTSAGEALLTALDKRRVRMKAALWLYSPESQTWHLVLATPGVKRLGIRPTLRVVQQALEKIDSPLRLMDIRVVDSSDKLVAALASALPAGKKASGVRLPYLFAEGVFIEDAYLYRLAA